MIGEEASADIVRNLDDDEVAKIGREVARLSSISADQAEDVLEEFHQMSVAQDYVVKGGMDYARKLLVSAFGPGTAKKLLDRLSKSLTAESASFDAIQKADPQQLAKFIHSEHPQTIALILSHLNPPQAAGLLFSLPAEMRGEVALRMANLDQISPEIISKIAGVISSKLQSLGEFSREAYGGVHAVSEMFNRLDPNTSKEILESIERSDPNLAETIRHLMFVFEDLLVLDQNAVKELVPKIDKKILTIALKGTSEQLKNHLLAAMSQRGADMLREDMEALGPVKIKDVESAQQQIIALARKLEAEGVISIHATVGEQYVV
jgi:flagellar motor switch protein FliG